MADGFRLPSAELAALCRRLIDARPLPALLAQLAQCAAEWTYSDDAELVLLESAARPLPHEAAIRPLRAEDSAARWIQQENRPLVVPDLNYAPFDSDIALQELGVQAYAGVPVVGERFFGVLFSYSRKQRDFGQGELAVLELLAALAALAISRQRLTSRLEEAHRTMVRFALVDPLTNLASQRHFEYILKREWQRSVAEVLPLSLLKLELDGVSAAEGRVGAERQRRIIVELARLLDGALYRPSDLVARVAANAFVVLLPNTGSQGARAIAERLLSEVRQRGLRHPQLEQQLTVSIGIASYEPLSDSLLASADALVAQVERALSRAKQRGGDGVAGP